MGWGNFPILSNATKIKCSGKRIGCEWDKCAKLDRCGWSRKLLLRGVGHANLG